MNPGRVLLGTQSGLYRTEDGGANWYADPHFREKEVYEIEVVDEEAGRVLVASQEGLFAGIDGAQRWERIYARPGTAAGGDDDGGSGQIEIESMSAGRPDRLFFMQASGGSGGIILNDGGKVLRSEDGGLHWRLLGSGPAYSGLSSPEAVGDGDQIVIPASDGVYLMEAQTGREIRIGSGLPEAGVEDIAYDAAGDVLYAAGARGIYRLRHPEAAAFFDARAVGGRRRAEEIFSRFEYEPAIGELREAAMRYAEVHPEKIRRWRRAASAKSWFPSLNVGYDFGTDETVELDRGGTGDPDRFIVGPVESSYDWSVNLNWDLSELVWNPDQTSIDNRSKLMVQLREDLLNQLTHLFYARRELQIDSMLMPEADLAEEIRRRLKIEEYTSGIDDLTGGYLTRALESRSEE